MRIQGEVWMRVQGQVRMRVQGQVWATRCLHPWTAMSHGLPIPPSHRTHTSPTSSFMVSSGGPGAVLNGPGISGGVTNLYTISCSLELQVPSKSSKKVFGYVWVGLEGPSTFRGGTWSPRDLLQATIPVPWMVWVAVISYPKEISWIWRTGSSFPGIFLNQNEA